MTELKAPPLTAQMVRLCCDAPRGNRGQAGARWQLYVATPALKSDWPRREWPTRERHRIPTIPERLAVLAELGYEPLPEESWVWGETSTSPSHPHPARVHVYASIQVRPRRSGQGGES